MRVDDFYVTAAAMRYRFLTNFCLTGGEVVPLDFDAVFRLKNHLIFTAPSDRPAGTTGQKPNQRSGNHRCDLFFHQQMLTNSNLLLHLQ